MSARARAPADWRNNARITETLRRGAHLLACTLLIALESMATARAQVRGPAQASSVIVVPHDCDAALVAEVARILPIELGPARADAAARPSLRIVLSCAADAVELRDPITAPAGLRTRDAPTHLDLSTTPNGLRPRVVALQIAELVRNIAAPPRASATTTPSAPRALPGRRTQLSLAGLARLSTFRGDDKWLVGGGLNLTLHVTSLALGLELGASTRRDRSPLGEVRVWSGQLAPHASFGLSFAATTLRIGAGYAFGFARMRGKAAQSSAGSKTLRGYWSAPFALLTLEQALHERVRLHLSGIVGWVRPAVVGEVAQGRDIAIAGIWSELRLGAAYRF